MEVGYITKAALKEVDGGKMKPKIMTGKEIRNKAWLTIYEEQDEYVYATEYDALLPGVRELVDAANKVWDTIPSNWDGGLDDSTHSSALVNLKEAIAAVEKVLNEND